MVPGRTLQGTAILQPTPVPIGSPAASPAPAPAASPSPVPTPASPVPASPASNPAAAGESGGSSHVGAIVGGVVGGFFGAMALAGLAIFIVRRRQAAAAVGGAAGVGAGQGGLRTMWTTNPLGGATASISTGRGGASKGGADLTEITMQSGTPNSARRRNAPTPFA